MATSVVNVETKNDALKWVLACALIIAGIVGNVYFSQVMLAVRLLLWLLLAAAITAIVLQTGKGKIFWGFLRETRIELHKVVWPTRQETIQMTMVVLVIVVITGLLLWGVDTFFVWVVSQIAGNGVG